MRAFETKEKETSRDKKQNFRAKARVRLFSLERNAARLFTSRSNRSKRDKAFGL